MKICDHLQYKLTGGSYVFSSQENKSCMQSICADVCAEVSGYFHPNFHDTFFKDDLKTIIAFHSSRSFTTILLL